MLKAFMCDEYDGYVDATKCGAVHNLYCRGGNELTFKSNEIKDAMDGFRLARSVFGVQGAVMFVLIYVDGEGQKVLLDSFVF